MNRFAFPCVREGLKNCAETQEKIEGVFTYVADARKFTEKRKGRGEGVVTYVDLSRLALKKTRISASLFVLC